MTEPILAAASVVAETGGVVPDEIYDAYLFDLDGTIYLGSELLPGAKQLIENLRSNGAKTIFL